MQVYPFILSDDETAAPADDLKIYCAADCPAQPVEWLWTNPIASEKSAHPLLFPLPAT